MGRVERDVAMQQHRERSGEERSFILRATARDIEGERERERESNSSSSSSSSSSRTFFTIQRIYLRALFARVIPATYKAFLPLSAVEIQREN